MEVLVFFVTIIIGVYAEAWIGVKFNMPGIGTIVAAAFVGSIILWTLRHKERDDEREDDDIHSDMMGSETEDESREEKK